MLLYVVFVLWETSLSSEACHPRHKFTNSGIILPDLGAQTHSPTLLQVTRFILHCSLNLDRMRHRSPLNGPWARYLGSQVEVWPRVNHPDALRGGWVASLLSQGIGVSLCESEVNIVAIKAQRWFLWIALTRRMLWFSRVWQLPNKYVVESERGVREIFHKARAAAPFIIFFVRRFLLIFIQRLTCSVGQKLLGMTVVAETNRPDVIVCHLLAPSEPSS